MTSTTVADVGLPEVLVRFLAFVVWTLGAPAAAFWVLAPRDAEEAGPAMLVFLLSPALAGWVCTRGTTPREPGRGRTLSSMGLALAVTTAIVVPCTAAAFAAGTLVRTAGMALAGAVAGAAIGLVTSTLEELGWAAGGTTLARSAMGPRAGVLALGLVWAAWHLVVAALAPPETVAGLFGTEGPLGLPRTLSFVLGCVAFRCLLTALRDRADNVWPAIVGHATGNVLLGALLGAGAARIDGDWWFFPGPSGLMFLAGVTLAAVGVHRLRPVGPPPGRGPGGARARGLRPRAVRPPGRGGGGRRAAGDRSRRVPAPADRAVRPGALSPIAAFRRGRGSARRGRGFWPPTLTRGSCMHTSNPCTPLARLGRITATP